MLENNNIQAGLANVNAKAEIKTDIKGEMKVADKVVNQIGGTTNNNDYSNNAILNQNFYISVIPNINCAEGITNALKLGNENALLVGNEVQKLLSDNGITETQIQEKLSNPDVLATIAEANKIAYTTDDVQKRKILADLIYSKIISTEDFESTILSYSINILPKTTENQLKVLSLLYILKSDYFENIPISSLEEFQLVYKNLITPLLEFKTQHPEKEIFNLYSIGCIVVSMAEAFLNKKYFANTVRKFVDKYIPETEIDSTLYQTTTLYKLGLKKINQTSNYIIDDSIFGYFYSQINKCTSLDEKQKDKMKELYVKYGYDSDEYILQYIPEHKIYMDIINEISNCHFYLTPVGKTLAKSYIYQRLGKQID